MSSSQIKDPETGEWIDYYEWLRKQKAKQQAAAAQHRRTQVPLAGFKVAIYFQIGFLILAAVIALIVIASGLPYERLTVDNFDATVVERFLCGVDKTHYCVAVVRDDGVTEVLTNQDSLWWWKWRSTDLEPRFQPGERLHFTVFGWRLGWPTMFRNIISAEPLGG
jgi:hypothetical protein